VNCICDFGKAWRFRPEQIAVAGFILLVLGRGTYNVVVLARESETIWPAIEHSVMILGCSAVLVIMVVLLKRFKGRKNWTT